MNILEKELTQENILEYGMAVGQFSEFLKNNLSTHPNLLIPSRGALPFYKAAKVGTQLCSMYGVSKNSFPKHNTIIVPFTADYVKSEFGDEISSCIRDYWVSVYQGLVDGKENISTQFYRFILKNIVGLDSKIHQANLFKKPIESDYLPKLEIGSGTLFIDTVISGRASSEILNSMKRRDVDIKPFLIVDEGGKKLKPEYGVRELVEELGGEIITVPRIFTEDRSPAFTGATSLVFPDLMIEASKLSQFKDLGVKFPGAGVWFNPPIKNFKHDYLEDVMSEFSKYPLMHVSSSVESLLNYSFLSIMGLDTKNSLQTAMNFRDEIINRDNTYEFDNIDMTLKEYSLSLKLLRLKPSNVGVSSSHVLRGYFLDSQITQFVRDFQTFIK